MRQRNAGTRAGYRRDLNAFLDWWSTAAREHPPLKARKSDLEDYATQLAALELKPASQLRRLAVASAFYELAVDEQLRETTPMRGIRRPNAANEDARLGLDARSAERLLEYAQEHSEPAEGPLVVLLLLRGLRISEALSLRAGDITLRETGAELRILREQLSVPPMLARPVTFGGAVVAGGDFVPGTRAPPDRAREEHRDPVAAGVCHREQPSIRTECHRLHETRAAYEVRITSFYRAQPSKAAVRLERTSALHPAAEGRLRASPPRRTAQNEYARRLTAPGSGSDTTGVASCSSVCDY